MEDVVDDQSIKVEEQDDVKETSPPSPPSAVQSDSKEEIESGQQSRRSSNPEPISSKPKKKVHEIYAFQGMQTMFTQHAKPGDYCCLWFTA